MSHYSECYEYDEKQRAKKNHKDAVAEFKKLVKDADNWTTEDLDGAAFLIKHRKTILGFINLSSLSW